MASLFAAPDRILPFAPMSVAQARYVSAAVVFARLVALGVGRASVAGRGVSRTIAETVAIGFVEALAGVGISVLVSQSAPPPLLSRGPAHGPFHVGGSLELRRSRTMARRSCGRKAFYRHGPSLASTDLETAGLSSENLPGIVAMKIELGRAVCRFHLAVSREAWS